MAKFIKFTEGPWQAPLPTEDSEEGQMLRYLRAKYGATPVDQFELMTELNTHQTDGAVVKDSGTKIMRPLSQLFGFKVPGWAKAGFIERVTAKVLVPKEPGKMARMIAHIAELEAKLKSANIAFTPLPLEEEAKKAA